MAASAGSGKTRILTDRVLRFLIAGVSPSKILCLTFTKVAAAEMQKRIFAELESWIILSDEKLQNRLTDLTDKIPSRQEIKRARKLFTILLDDNFGLQISTIHSFCQGLIKKFPLEAKISPNFEVIDEQKENQLLFEARKILLKMAISDSALAKKINLITARLNEDSFLGITSEIIKKRQNLTELKDQHFGIDGVVKAVQNHLQSNNTKEVFYQFVIDKSWQKEQLKQLCIETEIKSKKSIINFINNATEENLTEYLDVFLTTENEPRKRLVTKEIQKQFGKADEIMSFEQGRVVDFLEKFNSATISESTSALLLVVDKIIEIYSQLKTENGYLDYNDLIIKTNQLLENSANRDWIKYKLDGAIEHILVDESQDTNHHQWNIIKAISEEFFAGEGAGKNSRTVFVVGDEKQSIYSFQGADPNIFSDIFYYYQEKLNLMNQKFLNIELAGSFRSAPKILQAVDAVFAKSELAEAISTLTKNIKHYAIKNHYQGKVEIMPLVSRQLSVDGQQEKNKYKWNLDFRVDEEYHLQEILAKNIAKKISRFFVEKKFLVSKNRTVEYGDVMILLKERQSNLGNLLIKYLQKEQIPVSKKDKINFSKDIIIQDLLALAKFILLPEDDLNLACLFKSPLVGYALNEVCEEELLELCLEKNQQGTSLWAIMASSKNSKIQEKYQLLLNLIEQNQLQKFSSYQFFSYVLIEQNGLDLIESRFGDSAREVVDQFLKICLDYQNNNIASSLQHFVHFIDSTNLQIKISGTNHNQVRITTVHGAKGLEAPIVFVADALHSAQKQSGNDKRRIFWDKVSGLPFWSGGKVIDNRTIKEIKERDKKADKQEYLRQLYVAMTRAEEELYIAGYGEDGAKDCWYNVVADAVGWQG